MIRFGIDEDWQRLTPAELLAAGKTFIIGYVSEDATGKNITPAEVQAALDAGLGVLLVYEYAVAAVEGGAAKGHRDAGIGIAGARARGYPAGCALAFAVDEDETGHPANIHDYAVAFTGDAHAAGYRSMDYGGLATVRYCADNHLADLHWQTYAWSGVPTVWDPRAAIRQVRNGVVIDGKAVDLDVAQVDDFGAWFKGGQNMADLDRIERLVANAERILTYFCDPTKTTIVGLDYGDGQGADKTLPNPLTQTLDAVKAQGAGGVTQDMINTAVLQALSTPSVLDALAKTVAYKLPPAEVTWNVPGGA